MLEPQLFKLLERTADAGYSVTAAGEICSWNGAASSWMDRPRKWGRDITR